MPDWSTVRRQPPGHRVDPDDVKDPSAGASRQRSVRDCTPIATFAIGLSVVLVACFVALLTALPNDHDCPPGAAFFPLYNTTYPLSEPKKLTDGGIRRRIAVITDLDHGSKSETEKNTWYSFMRYGYLDLDVPSNPTSVSIVWDADTLKLKSTLSQGGRGMELSELKVFDGHLISVDDRTGVIYRIIDQKAIPWVLMPDGPGNINKGFKAEWAAVKDNQLHVGGLGKEWTTTEGVFQNYHPMWIKIVTHTGFVRHVDWVENYKKLRRAAGIEYPGYMIHESAQWSDVHGRWFFLPRRASKESYTEEADERRATNYMLIADEQFNHVEARRIGPLSQIRGFSAFQFVPGTDDSVMVALKSEEDAGTINSYITVINVNTGKVILEEKQLEGHYKFEGIEFV